MKQICKLVVMLLLAFTAGVQAQLVTYPESLNPGMPHNDDYTVRVRIPGGEWKDLFEWLRRRTRQSSIGGRRNISVTSTCRV